MKYSLVSNVILKAVRLVTSLIIVTSLFLGGIQTASAQRSTPQLSIAEHSGGSNTTTANVPVEESSSTGLISYWSFDEGSGSTTSDIAPASNGNTGSLVNSPLWLSSPFGNALSFTAASEQYVSTLNNSDSLSIPSGGMTITAWIKVSDISGEKTILAKDKEAITKRGNYSLVVVDGKLRFGFSQASDYGDNWIDTQSSISPNRWYFVAVTHTFGNSSATAIYIDGVSQPLGSWECDWGCDPDSAPTTFIDPLYIGKSVCNGEHFDGSIDEVKVYNRILNSEEIMYTPNIVAQYPNNIVTGRDWTFGDAITLEIDDPSNGPGVDYTDTQTVGLAYFDPSLTYVEFDLGTAITLGPGLHLNMTDGVTTKELTTVNLEVTSVDVDTEVISGTADPGADLNVHILGAGVGRHEQADGAGNWLADFSVPGDEGWESPTYDIQPGDFGIAAIADNDSDETRYYWDVPYKIILKSQGKYDGWILESSETSGKGGTKNSKSKTFYVGDDAYNRQYRAILSFNTSAIPDDAIITSVKLKVKKAGLVGKSPFKTHKGLRVDIRKGKFGTSPKLQLSDFQAKASKNLVGKFSSKAVSKWYTANLGSASYTRVNKTGLTQFRLRFYKDDNNDCGADYFKFYSGNAGSSSRPQLIVEYTIP